MATFNLEKGYDLNLEGQPDKEIISMCLLDMEKYEDKLNQILL